MWHVTGRWRKAWAPPYQPTIQWFPLLQLHLQPTAVAGSRKLRNLQSTAAGTRIFHLPSRVKFCQCIWMWLRVITESRSGRSQALSYESQQWSKLEKATKEFRIFPAKGSAAELWAIDIDTCMLQPELDSQRFIRFMKRWAAGGANLMTSLDFMELTSAA